MAAFQELDPALVWKIIEGYENELEPETKTLEVFYRQFSCPRCQGPLGKEYDPRHAFSDPGTMNPRALLRCSNCRYLIDPHTGLVLESGNPAKMPIEIIPIVGQK